MGSKKGLIDALRRITTNNEVIQPIMCKVKASSYNSTNKTVDVSPINGDADMLGVLINANKESGFLLVPKDNTVVGVVMTSNSTGFVSMVSEVDLILLNGDANGGLIKIDNLKTQYDAMLVAFKAACVAGFTALSGLDSGASLAAFNAAAASIQNLNKTPLENTTVKHGNG